MHISGREKIPEARNQKNPSKSIIPDSILMFPEVKSRLNERKRSRPVKNRVSYFFIFFGDQGTRHLFIHCLTCGRCAFVGGVHPLEFVKNVFFHSKKAPTASLRAKQLILRKKNKRLRQASSRGMCFIYFKKSACGNRPAEGHVFEQKSACGTRPIEENNQKHRNLLQMAVFRSPRNGQRFKKP